MNLLEERWRYLSPDVNEVLDKGRKRNIKDSINPFVPNAPFLYPRKTSENLRLYWERMG